MNEERSKEEGRGVSHAKTGVRGGEFAQNLGDVQHRGSRVLAVPPSGPPVPVGIAPPDPRNVVSIFDTRPIGGYDFANTQTVTMGNGEVTPLKTVTVQAPDGYTAVLRRVRLEFTPPAAMQVVQPGNGSAPTNIFTISLMRNNGIIPNNVVKFYGALDEYEWPTHQVFGSWESFGLQLDQGLGFAFPGNALDAVFIGVTFMGVLIPTKSLPPEVEIASDPVITRDYERLVNTAPDVGAAGR